MNDKPEAVALKPCPFCDDEACCSPSTESDEPEREDREPLLWGVGCGCTAFVGPFSTEAEAVAAWNTRATSQPDASALVEALRLASGRLKWVSTANPGAGCDNGRTLAASWADDAAAALTAWEAQHG